MNHTRNIRYALFIATSSAFLWMVPTDACAFSAADDQVQPAPAQTAPPSAPLAGPKVGKDAESGKDAFGQKGPRGNNNKDRMPGMAQERRNMELWKRAFEQLMPELSPEVQESVRNARMDFEGEMKEWRAANGDKVAALEQKIRARAQEEGAKKPDQALMREMTELRASAPKVDLLQQKLWAMLSPDEQGKFKTSYDTLKLQMEQRKDDRKDGKSGKDGKNGTGSGDAMTPDPMLPGGAPPSKRPDGKPFNFDKSPDDPARKGDGKPSGK